MKQLVVRRWSSPLADAELQQVPIEFADYSSDLSGHLDLVIAPPVEFASPEFDTHKWLAVINNKLAQRLCRSPSKSKSVTAQLDSHHRIFYMNHESKSTSWLPPTDEWSALQNHSQLSIDAGSEFEELSSTSLSSLEEQRFDTSTSGLPYGWEEALDDCGRHYYINHLNCSTTYELPQRRRPSGESSRSCSKTASSDEHDENPTLVERRVTLHRPSVFDQFGFVIGSQRPSIVKFVQPAGPSDSLLSIGDRILEVNGASVVDATRQHIIALFRASGTEVTLTVGQPLKSNKSSILTIAKREKLREKPRRVRFVESVMISGSPLFEVEHPLDEYRKSLHTRPHNKSNSNTDSWHRKLSFLNSNNNSENQSVIDTMNCARSKGDDSQHNIDENDLKKSNSSCPPFVNVIKIFLENGQTKTFKYDGLTTVQNIIDLICEKQHILHTGCFAIVAEPVRNHGGFSRNILLDNRDKIVKIVTRPDAHSLRCLFRMVFPPPDPLLLLELDPSSFEYLFEQCANDIVLERAQPEVHYDSAIRLSALRVLEYAFATGLITDPKSRIPLKKLDDEVGLLQFVPKGLAASLKPKELIRILEQAYRNVQSFDLTESRHVRLRFLELFAELPCYGAQMFTNLVTRQKQLLNSAPASHKSVPESESKKLRQQHLNFPDLNDQVLLNCRAGLCRLHSTSNLVTGAGLASCSVARVENIERIVVSPHNENQFEVQVFVSVQLSGPAGGVVGVRSLRDERPTQVLSVVLDTTETEEFLLVTRGYHKLLHQWSFVSENKNGTNTWQRRNDGERSAITPSHNQSLRPYRPIECVWETPTDQWWMDGAPRFYGPHTVFGAGWNYPHFTKQRVDLAVPPPRYNHSYDAFKNRLGLTEVIASSNSRDSALYADSLAGDIPEQAECIDMPSVVSFEILENINKPNQNVEKDSSTKNSNKNSDVLHRVSEMNRILRDAERYLSNQEPVFVRDSHEDTPCRDSYMSDIFPQLLKAETDLLDMMRSLNAEPNGNVNSSNNDNSALRLDLDALSPPKTPEKMLKESHESHHEPPTPYKNSALSTQSKLPSADDASERIVAELDSLFVTLNRMKNNFHDDVPQEVNNRLDTTEDVKRNSNNSEELMLTSFDHLTDSINQLVAQMEQCSTGQGAEEVSHIDSSLHPQQTQQTEFMSNLVLPPPPSVGFASGHNEVVEQFWRATEDLKRICTTNSFSAPEPNYYENFPPPKPHPLMPASGGYGSEKQITPALSAEEIYVRELAQQLLAQHSAAQQQQQQQQQLQHSQTLPAPGHAPLPHYSQPLLSPSHPAHQQQQSQPIGRSQSLQLLSSPLPQHHTAYYSGHLSAATPPPVMCSILANGSLSQDTTSTALAAMNSQSVHRPLTSAPSAPMTIGHSSNPASSSSSATSSAQRNGSSTAQFTHHYSPKPPLPPQQSLSSSVSSSAVPTATVCTNPSQRHNTTSTTAPPVVGVRHAHVVKQLSAPPLTQFQQQQQSIPPPPYSFAVNSNATALNSTGTISHSPFLSSATPSPTSSTSGSAAFTTIPGAFGIQIDYNTPASPPQIPESKRVYFQGKEIAEIFAQSQFDIDCLLARLEDAHETRLTKAEQPEIDGHELEAIGSRESLGIDARHFVTASKFFVKCANEASFQILDYLAECMALLGRMFAAAEETLFHMGHTAHVTCLVDRLKECAATFAYTVETVHRLLSFPDSLQEENPYSAILNQHAATLTMNLNTLLRTLNLS